VTFSILSRLKRGAAGPGADLIRFSEFTHDFDPSLWESCDDGAHAGDCSAYLASGRSCPRSTGGQKVTEFWSRGVYRKGRILREQLKEFMQNRLRVETQRGNVPTKEGTSENSCGPVPHIATLESGEQ
jgi:hypothetical protein